MTLENDKLLREWEIIMRRVESIDARIWQGAGIILIISLGAISLLGWSTPISQDKMVFAVVAGIFSILVLLVWWFIFHRWIYLQRIYGYRAREIEDQCDLRVNRYARIIEYWESTTANDVGKKELKSKDVEAFQRLEKFYTSLHKRHFVNTTIQWCLRWLTILLASTWFIYTLMHVIVYYSSKGK